jgi:hypothetical protein
VARASANHSLSAATYPSTPGPGEGDPQGEGDAPSCGPPKSPALHSRKAIREPGAIDGETTVWRLGESGFGACIAPGGEDRNTSVPACFSMYCTTSVDGGGTDEEGRALSSSNRSCCPGETADALRLRSVHLAMDGEGALTSSAFRVSGSPSGWRLGVSCEASSPAVVFSRAVRFPCMKKEAREGRPFSPGVR